jgi:hypothetical protein
MGKTIYCLIDGFGGCGYDVTEAFDNEERAQAAYDRCRKEILLGEDAERDGVDLNDPTAFENAWTEYLEYTDEAEVYLSEVEITEGPEEDNKAGQD